MEQNEIYNQQKNLDQINVKSAWTELEKINSSIKYGDDSIVVAVVDFVGIESQSQIVEGEEKIVPTNPVFGNINGKEKIPLFFRMATGEMNNNFSLLYSGNHGTGVAGIIAANKNDKSICGVAPNVRLLSIELKDPKTDVQNLLDIGFLLKKICGIPISTKTTQDNLFPTINKEDSASILNLSIGISDRNNTLSNSINDIFYFGRDGLGGNVVVAAGNRECQFAEYIDNRDIVLQCHSKTITVGAVKKDTNRSEPTKEMFIHIDGTTYGSELDIVAPGENILTTSCIELGSSCSQYHSVIVTNKIENDLYVDDISKIVKNSIVVYKVGSEIKTTFVIKKEENYIRLIDSNDVGVNTQLFVAPTNGVSLNIPLIRQKSQEVHNFYIDQEKIGNFLFSLNESVIIKSSNGNIQKVQIKEIKLSPFPLYSKWVFSIDFIPKIDITLLGEDTNLYVNFLYGDLFNFNLTSAATPHVSGVVALILSANNTLNWIEVKKILRDTTKKDNLSDYDVLHLSRFNGRFCKMYGFGMVNAENAVKEAKKYLINEEDEIQGKKNMNRYDLCIKRSESDNGEANLNSSEINVPNSDLECSPYKIKAKIYNKGGANNSGKEELRYLIGFSDLLNPIFVFPYSWIDNSLDNFYIGRRGVPILYKKVDEIELGIKKTDVDIEKILRKCPADKHPYLLVHITPFDYGVTGNSVRTNNNLAYKRDVFLNAEFLQGDGTTRLPNSLPKSETPVPFKINVKMYNKAGAIDLNGMELKVKGFVKKNQENKEEQENKNTVFYAKYEGATFRTEIEQNNIVTDISTEVVDRNAQDKVTEVVISGNIHISELYKKLQITVTVPNCLNECTHEIRRKSAVFSKFTSAPVEDVEFREKIYFITDCDNLSNTKKYGAISSGDTDFQAGFDRYRITNVFAVEGTQETNTENGTETTNETNSETSTPHKAYAVCKGKILVQEDKDDASLVNIVLKPEMHSSNNPAVKYFVYRGILKSSLYESDNSLKTNGNSVVSWIEKNIKEPDGRILGMELTNDASFGDEASIDNAFYNSDGEFELLTVPAGWCIGTFADNYIGFEIWLDTIGFNPTFSMIRNHETIITVEQLPMNPTDGDISAQKALKEQILNYMDPAAYFGNMYDDRIFVRNTNSEASRDGIEYSFEKVKKENLYTQIIDNFLNKNVVYIDIRNEFNTSYNYFGNYGEIKLDVIRDKEQQPTTEVCYESSNWPIIATTFTPSFDDGVVKMAFKKGDNETPLAYVAIGERGRTLAEKIAQGKTNFVDLTAENGDYTDNSVAMVVTFRKNTAPNMENTYISVASYMRIDYLRRMKPKTPNNQETQEPQEQQEPQTPENTENLPVWKQRKSSADLLFRPMDMKLPIENVTEGFVVKVYEDEVYIDVPEHEIDYMARMGIARDPENTYLFAVKSDLHTKNAFQMSNPRVSICSGFYKTGVSFLNYLTQNNLYKITINETGEFVLKIENKYAKDYLIAPDKETDFVIFAFSNQEYEKILQSIQSINNAQSSVYLSMKEIEKYEKASSYNLQLTYINADNQVKNSTIQIENNDNKLTMLG